MDTKFKMKIMDMSLLQKSRLAYKPKFPKALESGLFQPGNVPLHVASEVALLFPHTVNQPLYELVEGGSIDRKRLKIGVVFSGGPAPGGHNVICALFDSGAELVGFLNGASGVVEDRFKLLEDVELYRNQGGFDLIGSGRTKIETEEQLEKALQTAMRHGLDALVIIGGDDSNTNAAVLAEYFTEHRCDTKVIGVPKTIDGDLQSDQIEISFGFDSACKTYAELIGNIMRDALSSKKYFHFIRLMGRSASHVTLECALQTRPNLALISEERLSLDTIVKKLADLVEKRSKAGKEYGIVLIPEGLIESIPNFQEQLKGVDVEKDPHGNIQISQIETEKLLISLVKEELAKRQYAGKFYPLGHFFGYEGRACLPSNFDANYCYTLGKAVFAAAQSGLSGVILGVQNLKLPPEDWKVTATPITHLMQMEERLGKNKPVIKKSLVDLKGAAYIKYTESKSDWELEDAYVCPGPIQFFGDQEITDRVPSIL